VSAGNPRLTREAGEQLLLGAREKDAGIPLAILNS